MSDGSTNTYLHEISEQDSYMYIHADMLHTNVTYIAERWQPCKEAIKDLNCRKLDNIKLKINWLIIN